MATAEQMAAYTQVLLKHTSAQNKPVTEIAIFKLKPEFAADHAAATVEFESQMVSQTAPGRPHASGIRRISWGFSENDPATLVWMLDWNRIQDHWDFWQTPGFPPVMGAITRLFEPGRPLVRHYDFGETGMLGSEAWARIFVWEDPREGATAEEARGRVLRSGSSAGATGLRQAYAVDVDEMNWYCLLLGYEDEGSARAEEVLPEFQGEDHIVKLQYFDMP